MDKSERLPETDGESLRRAVSNQDIKTIERLLNEKVDVDSADNDGTTSLHIATRTNSSNIVEILISHGASIDLPTHTDRQYSTPLYVAVERGHEKIVKILLSNNAKVDLYTNCGMSLVDITVRRRYVDIARVLLSHGAPVDFECFLMHQQFHDVSDHCYCCVQIANYSGNPVNCYCCVPMPRHGYDEPTDPTNNYETRAYSSLRRAILYQDYTLVKLLIDSGFAVNPFYTREDSPLHMAVEQGNPEIVKILLKHGANVDAVAGWLGTPLHTATRINRADIAEILISHGATIDPVTNEEWATPLYEAVNRGHEGIVKILLSNNANVNLYTIDGMSLLDIAVQRGKVGITKVLLSHGVPVDSRCSPTFRKLSTYPSLNPSLHYAIANGLGELVKLLIDGGVAVNPDNINVLTPLAVALKRKDIGIIKTLLEHGANVDHKDDRLQTPLYAAVELRDIRMNITCGMRDIEITKMLLEHGANVDHKDDRLQTPLHRAIEPRHIKIVKMLLEHGTYVNPKNYLHKLRFPMAWKGRDKEIVKMLLEHGANVNPKDDQLQTPLHIAVPHLRLGVVETLLEHGADVESKDDKLKTPLHIAMQVGSCLHILKSRETHSVYMRLIQKWEKIIELLLKHGAVFDRENKVFMQGLDEAVRIGRIRAVMCILKACPDAIAPCCNPLERKLTILHLAVMRWDANFVAFLLRHGANVDAEDQNGRTPIFYVGKQDYKSRVDNKLDALKVARLLLIAQADVDIKGKDKEILYDAVENNHFEMVALLLFHNNYIQSRFDVAAESASECLFNGLHPNDKGVVKIWRCIALSIKRARDCMPDFSFFFDGPSTITGSPGGLKSLLSSFTSSHANSSNNDSSSLCSAINKNRWPLVLLFMCHDFYGDDKELKAALFLAISRGVVNVVEQILKFKPDVNVVVDNKGRPLLHQATVHVRPKIVELLIKNGCDVNAVDENGKTPLIHAVEGFAAYSQYVKREEMSWRQRAWPTKFPSEMFNFNRHYEIVKCLLKYGARVDLTDENFMTSLHGAFVQECYELVEFVLKHCSDVHILRHANCSLLLCAAIESKHREIAKLLIKHGANVNVTNESGLTAFHLAAIDDRCNLTRDNELMEMLLEHGADIDYRNERGETALHIAVFKREFLTVTVLLEYGADINITDNENRTPLDYAVESDIRELFIKMTAANLFLSQHNLQLMDECLKNDRDIYHKCKLELEKMREAKIGNTSCCFYDILNGINYARNESVVRTLESRDYEATFPVYSDWIKIQFKRAQRRVHLVDRSETCLNDLLGYNLCEHVVTKIAGNLRNVDLHNVIQAYTNGIKETNEKIATQQKHSG